MRPVNEFLARNGLLLSRNPCISPDFCLDWPALRGRLAGGSEEEVTRHPKSRFETAAGEWTLLEDERSGDCAWRLESAGAAAPGQGLAGGAPGGGAGGCFSAAGGELLR